MLVGKNATKETHYEILSVNEDASYEDIRTSYRSAILNSHPDKFHKASETSTSDLESGDKFLKVQKAWEVLSDSRSRAVYNCGFQAARETIVAEDVSLEDMIVEEDGEAVVLFYQCHCGDYFSIDSLDVGQMGYSLLSDGTKISIQTPDALPASIVLPCGSCSLKVCLLINSNKRVPSDEHL